MLQYHYHPMHAMDMPLLEWAKHSPSATVTRLPLEHDEAYWVWIRKTSTADYSPPETDFYIYKQFTQHGDCRQFLMLKQKA